MGYNNIHQLLEKYWEGDTTLQEEKQLKDFFNHAKVPTELKEYQPLFQYFEYESQLKLDNDFEDRLMAQLDNNTATIVPLLTRNSTYVMLRRIAAIALLIFSIGYGVTYYQSNASKPTTIALEDLTEEERLQFEQAKAALVFASEKLNRGASLAATGVVKVHKSTEKIRK